MLKISLRNSAGELAAKTIDGEDDCAEIGETVVDFIRDECAGTLHAGDTIRIEAAQ